jgi:amino acid transporter
MSLITPQWAGLQRGLVGRSQPWAHHHHSTPALPLGVLLALVACLFVASSIGQLAKHLPSAGGFATYTSRGLHPAVGFLVVWLYALAEANVGLPAAERPAHAG